MARLIYMQKNCVQGFSFHALIHNYSFRIFSILTAVWINLSDFNISVVFEKYLLRSLAYYLLVIFPCYLFSCMNPLHIFDISPFLMYSLETFFTSPNGCYFTGLAISCDGHRFSKLSYLSTLPLCFCGCV